MTKGITCEELIEDDILIDVRTKKEFLEAHITNAINIPILDDKEREEVGCVYKNESKEKAKLLGIQYATRRLENFLKEFFNVYDRHKKNIFYCARGGMRSGSVVSLLDSLEFKVYKLQGGYKSYRNFIINKIPKMNEGIQYIMLHGRTGVGKTIILNKLRELNFNVLDFERGANHRGSALGSVGLGESASQKSFETFIYESLKNKTGDYIFVEAESKRVGNAYIPDCIFNSMKNGYHILIHMPMEERVKILQDEYLKFESSHEEIKNSILKLDKQIGNKLVNLSIELLNNKKYDDLIILLNEKYYDPLYDKSIKMYKYDLIIQGQSLDDIVLNIVKFYNLKNLGYS